MKEKDLIAELIETSHQLYERKLIHATGGNTSVRCQDTVWISQTGSILGALSEKEIVKVDLNGNVLAGERPSKEMGMHLAMYRVQSGVNAVIHAHPTASTAYSTILSEPSANAVPPYTAAFYVRAGQVPMIPYHPSGDPELHRAVSRFAADHRAMLLRQHGVIIAGGNMAETLGILEEVEQCCQIALITQNRGAALTPDQCAAIDKALNRTWRINPDAE